MYSAALSQTVHCSAINQMLGISMPRELAVPGNIREVIAAWREVERDGWFVVAGGDDEQGHHFPYPVYTVQLENFFSLLSDQAWCLADYDPVLISEQIGDESYIEAADWERIKGMCTYCFRGEKFCDGHWGSLVEGGVIAALVNRIAELEDRKS